MRVRAGLRRNEPRSDDRGFTLVEIVVAIAVLGVTAVSILAAVVSGIGGSARHQEHATATAWLQSAADFLEVSPVNVCNATNNAASVKQAYQQDIDASVHVENSDGWADARLVVTGVQFWNGGAFGTTCYDDLQLISMTVTSPNGKVAQSLDFVKGPPYFEIDDPSAPPDTFSSCAVGNITWTSNKSGIVTPGTPPTLKLKKPSSTKPSKLKDDHIVITVKVTGNCSGKLRLHYQWPHYDGKGVLKHYHDRRVNLKLLRGGDGLTYTGKLGHHGDKFLAGQTQTYDVEQGRTKSKTWAVVGTGTVKFG